MAKKKQHFFFAFESHFSIFKIKFPTKSNSHFFLKIYEFTIYSFFLAMLGRTHWFFRPLLLCSYYRLVNFYFLHQNFDDDFKKAKKKCRFFFAFMVGLENLKSNSILFLRIWFWVSSYPMSGEEKTALFLRLGKI